MLDNDCNYHVLELQCKIITDDASGDIWLHS